MPNTFLTNQGAGIRPCALVYYSYLKIQHLYNIKRGILGRRHFTTQSEVESLSATKEHLKRGALLAEKERFSHEASLVCTVAVTASHFAKCDFARVLRRLPLRRLTLSATGGVRRRPSLTATRSEVRISLRNKKAPLLRCSFGGEGEIRTLEPLLTVTRFPVVRARPTTRLLHISFFASCDL